MDNISIKAPAKINLYLDVLGKRNDGYHDLKMIMQAISLYDVIDINKSENGINVDCDFKYVPSGEKNIAFKAAKLMIEKFNLNTGVSIRIKKQIPVAAGLAGGSTDAAAVMKGMNELFGLNTDISSLASLGREVGADVPFCIIGGTAIAEGVGEKITCLKSFSQIPIVLIKPDFGVSTAYVFKKYNSYDNKGKSDMNALIEAMADKNITDVGKLIYNALEVVTIEEHPAVSEIKRSLINLRAAGSMMSGSGPSVFGIFDSTEKASEAYNSLKKKYNQVFLTHTL